MWKGAYDRWQYRRSESVTHTKVTVTNDNGSVNAKQVLESLDDVREGNNDSK